MYSAENITISYASQALQTLGVHKNLSQIRETLIDAPVGKANEVARLLARLGDKDSIPVIRETIEIWEDSNQDLSGLLTSLQSLEGPSASLYIAELLSRATPETQKKILMPHVITNRDAVIANAIEEIESSAEDHDVQQLAKKLRTSF